jgi:hypothetical protein
MSHPAIATQIHEALYIHRRFTSQIPFHCELGDFFTKTFNIGFAKVFYLNGRVQCQLSADFS